VSNLVTPEMPQKLLDYLRPGAPALLLTTGVDGYPSSAYTWVVALDARRLRFSVDVGGSGHANLKRSGLAGLHLMGPGLAFLVKGRARFLKARIDAAAPASMELFELEVMGARDQSFPGVTVRPLAYEWPAGQGAAMGRMEQAVYTEMRDLGE
jgi:hypothetical protein